MVAPEKTEYTVTLLGGGGFIGSHLCEALAARTCWKVRCVDLSERKIAGLHICPRFEFVRGDAHDRDLVESVVQQSDVVVSLVALCNPALYTTIPRKVIDANFTLPQTVVEACRTHRRRLVHFSTSEVYGRTAAGLLQVSSHDKDDLLREDESACILGPIQAQRWSYACAKQLLERLIYASGAAGELDYTIVRPFNFIGPRMDFLPGVDGEGIPRVLACFMDALLYHRPLQLVDGGENRRVFTSIDDAVDALMLVLIQPQACTNTILNIGAPGNETSITGLAQRMIRIYKELRHECRECDFETVSVPSSDFYGPGYEDSDRRLPDIDRIRGLLGWEPKVDLETTLRQTMQWYIDEYARFALHREAG